MLEVIETGLRDFGRPAKLSQADQLLMALMYWREYRTEFHIGLTYSISEAMVCRTIKKVEDVLIQSKQFHLPGKKVLQPSDTMIEIVLMDATEQPIERPKKDKAGTLQWQKEGSHPKSAVDCQFEHGRNLGDRLL
jgi:Helix-turn-helix of DDE superfamily endonuclease